MQSHSSRLSLGWTCQQRTSGRVLDWRRICKTVHLASSYGIFTAARWTLPGGHVNWYFYLSRRMHGDKTGAMPALLLTTRKNVKRAWTTGSSCVVSSAHADRSIWIMVPATRVDATGDERNAVNRSFAQKCVLRFDRACHHVAVVRVREECAEEEWNTITRWMGLTGEL